MTSETGRRDVRLLSSTRIIRLFCYGFLSVVLALYLAAAMLLLRFSISQMDVPTCQSHTMAVVAPDERWAASGGHEHRPLRRRGDLAVADGGFSGLAGPVQPAVLFFRRIEARL